MDIRSLSLMFHMSHTHTHPKVKSVASSMGSKTRKVVPSAGTKVTNATPITLKKTCSVD